MKDLNNRGLHSRLMSHMNRATPNVDAEILKALLRSRLRSVGDVKDILEEAKDDFFAIASKEAAPSVHIYKSLEELSEKLKKGSLKGVTLTKDVVERLKEQISRLRLDLDGFGSLEDFFGALRGLARDVENLSNNFGELSSSKQQR